MKTTMIIILALSMFLDFPNDDSNPYNGYEDSWGNWVPGLITNETWMKPAPRYTSGKMVFYGPYAMDATAAYRGINYQEKGCLGGISLMSPIDIGKKAWVKVEDLWYGPFCVVDCAKKGDMYSIVVTRREAVEVNFDFAHQMGMVSTFNGSYEVYKWYIDVELLVNINPHTYFKLYPNNKPTSYIDFFLETVEYAERNSWKEGRILWIGREEYSHFPSDEYWETHDWIWKVWGHMIYWWDNTKYISYDIIKHMCKNELLEWR